MQKELYVTKENLSEKARDWIKEAFGSCGRHRTELPNLKSALLVVDMQKHFTNHNSPAVVPAAAEIAFQIDTLVKSALNKGVPVFATRHGHSSGDNFPFDHVWRNLLYKNDEMAEISLDCLQNEAVEFVEKSTYSAFKKTNLEQKLNDKQVKLLFLAGVTSHLCVESTARDAFSRGFLPVILADCSAAWTKNQHLKALISMASGIGTIAHSEDIFEVTI